MKQLTKKKNESLVLADGKFIFCDSRMVSEKFEVEHKKVVRAIERIKAKNERFQGDKLSPSDNEFSPVFLKFEDDYKGQKFAAYRLNETAFSMVAMRFETDIAFIWQRKFAEAFSRLKAERVRVSAQQQNEEWKLSRSSGKEIRNTATDVFQEFVEFATCQGSKNAKFYYKHLTNTVYKILGLIHHKEPSFRNTLNIIELNNLAVAEAVAARSLKKHMNAGIFYRDIFKLVQRDLEIFADSLLLADSTFEIKPRRRAAENNRQQRQLSI